MREAHPHRSGADRR